MNVRPTIANTTMASAATEYSYALPANTVQFTIKLRSTTAALQVAVISGESGTNYITLPAGSGGWTEAIKGRASTTTLYFQSPTASQTAEIISWQN